MRSLRTQLSLTIALVCLVTVSLISLLSNILINRQFEEYIMEQQRAETQSIADDLGQQYDAVGGQWNFEAIHTVCVNALYDGYVIKIIDSGGAVVWDAQTHDMALCNQIMDEIEGRMSQKRPAVNGSFLSQDYDITQSGRQIGVVNIRFYGPYFLSDTDFQFLDSLNLLLVSTGLVCLLLSILAGAWLARRISRPIAKTAVIAQEISAGNYAIQFEGKTKTRELQNLVSSINDLANALSMQEALRNRLTADVAHELRTPLATLGTHLEAMIEGIWAPTPERLTSCHEEILRLGKLVSDLERIEKVESDNLNLDRAPTDLLQLARTVCGSFESELANKNLRLDIDGEACVISIDKDRISGVISNLMSNAVKYTPENGQISVLVQSSEHTSILIVEDTGIGIPESELPFIFERFYRADKSRNRGTGGAGLGLAIVKSIVTAHGGAVSAQSVLGHGSRIIITLPKNAR